MIDQSTLYAMALTCIKGVSQAQALMLYKHLNYEVDCLFVASEKELPEMLSSLQQKAIIPSILQNRQEALERAEKEAKFIGEHSIQVLRYGVSTYPQRLLECVDAPLVLYYLGNANLNSQYVISMVGTRKITEYGKDMCLKITEDFGKMRPNALVVSGLAYGVDIYSHRGALQAGMETVGVLAHGLDRIYPAMHRTTASQMVKHGGLLTEYMSGTTPEKGNFLCRNRIVAGLSDGCLVVESAKKGGAMTTARIAQDYHKDVMAVPGRVTDTYSEGCNQLIYRNAAALVSSASDILELLNWPNEQTLQQHPKEQDMFGQFSEEEQVIVGLLKDNEGKQINQIVVESKMPVARISALLFDLEMRSIVRLLPGGRYRLKI